MTSACRGTPPPPSSPSRGEEAGKADSTAPLRSPHTSFWKPVSLSRFIFTHRWDNYREERVKQNQKSCRLQQNAIPIFRGRAHCPPWCSPGSQELMLANLLGTGMVASPPGSQLTSHGHNKMMGARRTGPGP